MLDQQDLQRIADLIGHLNDYRGLQFPKELPIEKNGKWVGTLVSRPTATDGRYYSLSTEP